MEPTSKIKIRHLLECSVCLNTFTRPKILPCSHTFCYACLLTVVRDGKVITCPQCVKKHLIPTRGVKGFMDNVTVNELLGLQQHSEDGTNSFSQQNQATADTKPLCWDCETPSACVFSCDHCHQHICDICFQKHDKMVRQIKSLIAEMIEFTTSQRRNGRDQDHVLESLEKLRVSKEETSGKVNKILEELIKRRDYFEEYFIKLETMYQYLLADSVVTQEEGTQSSAAGPINVEMMLEQTLDDLVNSMCVCDTSTRLQTLKRKICDLKTAAKFVFSEKDIKFVWEGVELGRLINLQVGRDEVVIDIRGQYGPKIKSKSLATECGTTASEDSSDESTTDVRDIEN